MKAKSHDALDVSLLFRLGIRPAYDRAGQLSVLRSLLVVGRIERVAVRTLVEDPARSEVAGGDPLPPPKEQKPHPGQCDDSSTVGDTNGVVVGG